MPRKRILSAIGCSAILLVYFCFWGFTASHYVTSKPVTQREEQTHHKSQQDLQHIGHGVDSSVMHRIRVKLAYRNRFLRTLKAFFLARGAVEVRPNRHRTALVVDISVGTLENLLAVKMAQFDIDYQHSILRSVVPYRVPPQIAFTVESISGLTDFPKPQPNPAAEPSMALVPRGYHISTTMRAPIPEAISDSHPFELPTLPTTSSGFQLPSAAALPNTAPTNNAAPAPQLSPVETQSTPTSALGFLTLMLPLSTLPALLAAIHLHTLYLESSLPRSVSSAPSPHSAVTKCGSVARPRATSASIRKGKARRRRGLKEEAAAEGTLPEMPSVGNATQKIPMIAGPIQKMDDESFQNDQAEAQSKQLSWNAPLESTTYEAIPHCHPTEEAGLVLPNLNGQAVAVMGIEEKSESGGKNVMESKVDSVSTLKSPPQSATAPVNPDRWYTTSLSKAVAQEDEDEFLIPEFAAFVHRDVVGALGDAEWALLRPASFI
eukprot:EG_transcript_7722